MDNKASSDDRELFQRSIGAVIPLVHTKIIHPHPPKRPIIHANTSTYNEINNPKDLSAELVKSIDCETSLTFTRLGVQAKQFKNLASGKLRYQAQCDLHHLTLSQAEKTLEAFIYQCQQQDYRVICIIHGKGKHTGNTTKPILKNLVNQRLREFSNVLAFCSAVPKHGGSGATYVLLKRR